MTDRIKTSDGVESIPLSKEEAEAIAKAAKEGDFTASEFGITKASSIKSSYVARQAVKAGATSAIIEAALVLGPEIYEIIKYGIENGQLDEEELKTAGIDGLSAAGDGFLKGSISNALVVMCKAGKLGAEYANPSPELIGAMTVLVIDGIKYGIMLGNGKISTTEYIDTMAQEVLVSAGTLGTAALVGMLFPGATLAIMLGSFVGGLVISAGYTTGKTYALAWIENTGVDLLLPVDSASESLKGVKETIKMKASDAIKSLKSISSKTTKGITIKVYDLTLSIQLYKPIEISEEGLELIEFLSLDCTSNEGEWHSDSEIKIDKKGFVSVNGEKTKDFWDGRILSRNVPLRLKIRNICGDETIWDCNYDEGNEVSE